MVDTVMALPPETKLMILAPVVSERKGEFVDLFQDLQAQGFVRFRVRSGGGTTNTAKAEIFEVDQLPKLKKPISTRLRLWWIALRFVPIFSSA